MTSLGLQVILWLRWVTWHGLSVGILSNPGLRRRWLGSINSVFTMGNVPLCCQLSEFAIAIWAGHTSVRLFWHFIAHFDGKIVCPLVTRLLGFFHLARYCHGLLHHLWPFTPASFISRLLTWLFIINTWRHHVTITFRPTFTHGLVLENLASWHPLMAVATGIIIAYIAQICINSSCSRHLILFLLRSTVSRLTWLHTTSVGEGPDSAIGDRCTLISASATGLEWSSSLAGSLVNL